MAIEGGFGFSVVGFQERIEAARLGVATVLGRALWPVGVALSIARGEFSWVVTNGV